jgi:hypothetical protein
MPDPARTAWRLRLVKPHAVQSICDMTLLMTDGVSFGLTPVHVECIRAVAISSLEGWPMRLCSQRTSLINDVSTWLGRERMFGWA